MNKLLFSILFALIPLIFWLIQYFLVKKYGIFDRFKKHLTCYYTDWIFVPINLLFLYTVKVPFNFYYLLLISILFNTTLHVKWGKIIHKTNSHLFSYKTKRINLIGFFHLIFSIIEFVVIVAILFFDPISRLILVELFLIFMYALGILFVSYKKYQKFNTLDFLGGGLIILAALIKFIYLI